MKQKAAIFKQSISALALCIILCLVYAQKGDRERSSFQTISGILLSLQNSHERFPGKDSSKFRYLEIDNYPQPFEVFIGKGTGDFKPKYENIDKLEPGDSLTIYFEETDKTKNEPVNNRAYFIDRGSTNFFIKGNAIKNWIYGLAIFCTLFIPVLIILKMKGKIT
jgi:hypothetical protein